jgi:predicted Zn-dependent protease
VPSGSDWLASHPSNDQRLQSITALAAQYKGQGAYQDEGRARYLKAIAGMTFGDSPEQGLVRGRNFYHEGLGIALTAPAGWAIQNDPEQLALVNAARDAAMLVRLVPAQAGKTHADVIRSMLKPSQGRVESTTVNGLQATRFTGARTGSNGQPQALEATVLTGPGERFYLLQTSAKDSNALQRARAQLREAEGSFRALSAQDRSAARPWVIKTVNYPRGGFAELAKASPLARPEQQLRLINGYYGGGEPAAGQTVKVVDTP